MFLYLYTTGSELMCYDCGHEDGDECNGESLGVKVLCQTKDPEQEHYGNKCYVGHTGNMDTQICYIFVTFFCSKSVPSE